MPQTAPNSPHTRALPGDPANPRETLARMLRVDHAGEYSAVRIYAGQRAVLRNHPLAPELKHMAEQEQVHLDAFNQILPEHRVRPSLLQPLWHVAGYALGAGTALLGPRAAMACTVAVESVITEHYDAQLARPEIISGHVRDQIQRFRNEELEHHNLALGHEAEQAPAYHLLSGVIKSGCKAAIWLAKRI